MVSRNYAGALAFTALLGCSVQPDKLYSGPNNNAAEVSFTKQEAQSVNGWIVSATASPLEESTMNNYISALISSEGHEGVTDPLRGKRVSLLYPTNDGPRSGNEIYTGGRPSNSGLLDIVRNELRERRAYVSEGGVFGGNYETRIAASRMPNMNPADYVVIADENPKLPADLKNVLFVKKNGNEYKLVESER